MIGTTKRTSTANFTVWWTSSINPISWIKMSDVWQNVFKELYNMLKIRPLKTLTHKNFWHPLKICKWVYVFSTSVKIVLPRKYEHCWVGTLLYREVFQSKDLGFGISTKQTVINEKPCFNLRLYLLWFC